MSVRTMNAPSPKRVLLFVMRERFDVQVAQLLDSNPLSVLLIVTSVGAMSPN
jgi:hypothetical protein